jgi:hypothetical protein
MNKKIGISAIGYECKEHLWKVLAPWRELRTKYPNQFFISVAHGVFPETKSLGYPILSTDGTIEDLEICYNSGIIDSLNVFKEPAYEKDIRNVTLPFLFSKDIDYLWLLDLQDEIYTEKEILSIISYIEEESFIPTFKINFKNYVFDINHYVDDFIAPRIWNNKLNLGVDKFIYDNDIIFKNTLRADQLAVKIIPKNIAFVKHLSWVGSKEYLNRKIEFQKNHYGQCSYMWNNEKECLDFDLSYYQRYNIQLPNVHKDN